MYKNRKQPYLSFTLPDAAPSLAHPNPYDAVLRESLRVRSRQQAPALGGYLVTAVVFVALWQEAPVLYAASWFGLVVLAMSLRLILTRRILAAIAVFSHDDAKRADQWLRASSLLNQTVVGAGIWIVGAGESHDAAVLVTIMIVLYGVGAMINLASDYRSFVLSLPLLLGQPIAYWLLDWPDGLRIGLPLVVLGLLMTFAVRSSFNTFVDSVRIRLEKDDLLEQLRIEHDRTQAALASAEEANRAKAAFMAAASHDLRQPLYAASILADTMLMYELPEPAQIALGRQVQALEALKALFDNLLDLSRFDAGGIQPNVRPTRLDAVLQTLDAEFAAPCRHKGLEWKASITPVAVNTDPELLLRLIGNLLTNAIRYTQRGSVTLAVRARADKVEVEVADTGPGIERADQHRIFDEFVQLANPQRDRSLGVGLGLAIVRRIDALLETRLRLTSEIGSGTRFVVTLPVVPDELAPAAEPRAAAIHQPLGMPLHVWVIENDELVCRALGGQLDAWGCEHNVAASRAEMLELQEACGRWPDAAIIDDMLGPGEFGLDVARLLAQHVRADRILLTTGNMDPQRLAELHDSGFSVMGKPVPTQSLRQWLSSIGAEQTLNAAA